MVFLAPIWLWLLLPWGSLAAWLLFARRRVSVPFLSLWPAEPAASSKQRGPRRPPLPVTLVLLAMLLAIVGAASPARTAGRAGPIVSVIVDRGMTMSAAGKTSSRFGDLADEVAHTIATRHGDQSPIDLILVPGAGAQRIRVSELSAAVQTQATTALDTSSILAAAVADRLANSSGAILLLSDRPPPIADDRLVVVSPDHRVENVGIVRVAAGLHPRAEMMVRLRNDSDRTRQTVMIKQGALAASSELDLPPRGGERDYFLPIAQPNDSEPLRVELVPHDALPADDFAYLASERLWPRIEVDATVPPELARLVESYGRRQPPDSRSSNVRIVTRLDALGPDRPGIIVDTDTGAPAAPPSGEVVVRADPITAHLDFPRLLANAALAGGPGGGWTPLVTRGDRVAIAVRTGAARQVWVGFGEESFASSVDFVVFWKNVFDSFAAGEGDLSSGKVGSLDSSWEPADVAEGYPRVVARLWPGIYTTPSGARAAINAPAEESMARLDPAWTDKLARLAGAAQPAWTPWSGGLYLAGLAGLLAAAIAWRFRRSLAPAPAASG